MDTIIHETRESLHPTNQHSHVLEDHRNHQRVHVLHRQMSQHPQIVTPMSTTSFNDIRSSLIPKHDITSTPLYKEIYANNIRNYSYIVAKQQGVGNLSPQQLRKMYLQHQHKARHTDEHNRTVSSINVPRQHQTTGDKKDSKVKDDDSVDYRYNVTTNDERQNLRAAVPLAYRSCRNFDERRKKKGSMCDISLLNDHKKLVETLSQTTYCQKHQLHEPHKMWTENESKHFDEDDKLKATTRNADSIIAKNSLK